jgi:hypothetical protein
MPPVKAVWMRQWFVTGSQVPVPFPAAAHMAALHASAGGASDPPSSRMVPSDVVPSLGP